MLMKPTVGRVVHVFTKDTTKQFNGMGEGPYAGVITQVFSDECVNIRVFPSFGEPWETASCLQNVGGYNRWAWPDRV
jgi:hypothetical protein